MIQFDNRGGELRTTTYFESDHARAGLVYLSINAGVARLLVPTAALTASGDALRNAITIDFAIAGSVSHPTIAIDVIDGDPAYPYVFEIDARQCDRHLPASEAGAPLPWIAYTQREGHELEEVARGSGTVRLAGANQ